MHPSSFKNGVTLGQTLLTFASGSRTSGGWGSALYRRCVSWLSFPYTNTSPLYRSRCWGASPCSCSGRSRYINALLNDRWGSATSWSNQAKATHSKCQAERYLIQVKTTPSKLFFEAIVYLMQSTTACLLLWMTNSPQTSEAFAS